MSANYPQVSDSNELLSSKHNEQNIDDIVNYGQLKEIPELGKGSPRNAVPNRSRSPFSHHAEGNHSKLNQSVQFTNSKVSPRGIKNIISPLNSKTLGHFAFLGQYHPSQTTANFNKKASVHSKRYGDKSMDHFNEWAKRSTTTGNTRNNIKARTNDFHKNALRNFKSPNQTNYTNKTAATKGRIDQYGNFISKDENDECFPGIKGVSTKDENLPTEAVEQDMIKFYGKFSSTFSPPDDVNPSYITSS